MIIYFIKDEVLYMGIALISLFAFISWICHLKKKEKLQDLTKETLEEILFKIQKEKEDKKKKVIMEKINLLPSE